MSRVDLQDWKEFTGQTGLGLTQRLRIQVIKIIISLTMYARLTNI